ncbi:MAG: hypothetical protein ABIJ97_16180 [Bacteroidota bacterium]
MNRKYLVLISLFVLQLPVNKFLAQNDSIEDISYYFDDGGISEGKNIVKLNVLAIINGDLPVSYEKTLTNLFSIEVGVGLLLPYYFPEVPQVFEDETEIENPDFGYSLLVNPKFYLQHKAPELNYLGVQYRRRNYNLIDNTIVYTDITINCGLQLNFAKRFVVDYNVGLGYRFKKGGATNSYNISNVAIPVSIKLGYIL